MKATQWLDWAMKIQALAQSGLTYTKDNYDIERYKELRNISAEIVSTYSEANFQKVVDLFTNETGYATPKVDIRAFVYHEGQILFVKEKVDNKWAIPGGWADIGETPSEIAEKEVLEEAGIRVKAERVLAILDMQRHNNPSQPYHIYKICIHCKFESGELKPGLETYDARYFPIKGLPELSRGRITEEQIKLLLKHVKEPTLGTYFD